jgi:hypothetical protein
MGASGWFTFVPYQSNLNAALQPTHEMVERIGQVGQLTTLYERGEGICIIVYKYSVPTEIYFEGASGD